MNIFKKNILLVSLLFVFSLQMTHAAQLSGIAAVVNNEVITQNQLNQSIQLFKKELTAMGQSIPAEDAVKKIVLNQLIDTKLVLQVAERAHINVSDDELNQAIKNIAKKNNLTLTQFKAALKNQGVTYTEYKKNIRRQIRLSKTYQAALKSKVSVSEKDIERQITNPANDQTQYQLIDILISPTEDETKNTLNAEKAAALRIKKAISEGKSVEQAVQTAKNKYIDIEVEDLEWKSAHELPVIFVTALEKLKKGDTSQPLEAENGVHLIQLIDLQEDKQKITRSEAQQRAYQVKLQTESKKWIETLRKQAYIEIK